MNQLQISDFLNTGFKSFSTYDCEINLPSMIDGFKISQRKCVYIINKSNKKSTVERFGSEVAAATAYHHGATNLFGVIVGLSQDFTGSNNVNWLTPIGQFGNILNHNPASARYISVEANNNFEHWFRKEDNIILEYEYEDGERIEPKYFIPVVPTILFNGTSGIGTGYSCKILSYNPEDVVSNVRAVLSGSKQKAMVPWYIGYKGKVEKNGDQTIFTGKFKRTSITSLKITDLPIGYDIDSYKEVLGKLIDAGEIKDYDDNSSTKGWDIDVYANKAFVGQEDSKLLLKLKLITKDSENITVWTEDRKIKHFETPEELIKHFVDWRLTKYEERRVKQISILKNNLLLAEEKIRFIEFYTKHSELFSKSSKKDIVKLLTDEKFENIDNLLDIKVYNMTLEQIEKFKKTIDGIKDEVNTLETTTAIDMYKSELK